jgi:hypothetical protein
MLETVRQMNQFKFEEIAAPGKIVA